MSELLCPLSFAAALPIATALYPPPPPSPPPRRTLSAQCQTALEVVEAHDRLLGRTLAVLVPCQEACQVLDRAVGLVATDGGAPEAQLQRGPEVERVSAMTRADERRSECRSWLALSVANDSPTRPRPHTPLPLSATTTSFSSVF